MNVVLVVLLVLLGYLEHVSSQTEPCLTPYRASGYCVDITQCSPLFAIISKRPIKPSDVNYLRNSHCGFEGNSPKVCCPLQPYNSVSEFTSTRPTRTRRPTPPKVIRRPSASGARKRQPPLRGDFQGWLDSCSADGAGPKAGGSRGPSGLSQRKCRSDARAITAGRIVWRVRRAVEVEQRRYGGMVRLRRAVAAVVAVGCLLGAVDAQDDLCYTPRDASGHCVVIKDCQPLYSILQNRPIKPADVDYLRKSQCGFEGTLPKVCCPSEAEQPKVTTAPSTSGGTEGVVTPVRSNLLPGTDVCGISTEDRIYGGEKTTLDEFPWMALVEYEKPNGRRGFYCGGVLINSRYILTAAHCLKGKDLPPNWKIVSVRLGEYNTETDPDCLKMGSNNVCAPPAVDVAVEETIAHENYNPYDINQYNDIALLRLIRNVQYSDYVKPICLPKSTQLLQKAYTGKNLVVAGWGKTENRSESNVKLKLEVPVNSNNDCISRYSSANVNLNNGQICAGGRKGKDSCRGDSGGPLMTLDVERGEVNWYSVGVVSFGPSPCGMENWPGVYTKVANYVNWIVSKLRP